MWQIKLIALGLFAIAVYGAIAVHDSAQRAIGAETIKAEYQRQRAEQAKQDEQIAKEGKAAVLRLLATAEQRNKAQDAKATSDAAAWKAASDARAKTDREYALWRETALPRFVGERLRQLTQPTPDEQGGHSLPAGTAIPAPKDLPATTGAVDQSVLGRIRAFLNRDAAP